jgi:hypothetical protein
LKRISGALLLLLLCSCAAKQGPYIPRIDALNELDSKTYDTLLGSEAIIAAAEKSNDAGTLPAFMKPVINILIDVHNSARVAWLGYRQAVGAENELEEAEALTQLMLNLDRQITSLFSSGGEP